MLDTLLLLILRLVLDAGQRLRLTRESMGEIFLLLYPNPLPIFVAFPPFSRSLFRSLFLSFSLSLSLSLSLSHLSLLPSHTLSFPLSRSLCLSFPPSLSLSFSLSPSLSLVSGSSRMTPTSYMQVTQSTNLVKSTRQKFQCSLTSCIYIPTHTDLTPTPLPPPPPSHLSVCAGVVAVCVAVFVTVCVPVQYWDTHLTVSSACPSVSLSVT